MSFQEELAEILAKTPCIDSDCGGQGGTWQGDPENPEPVQCQYCYQERYPFIEEALTSIINLVDKDIIGENFKHQNGQPMKNPAYECPECGEPNVEYTVNVCKNSMRAKLRDGE